MTIVNWIWLLANDQRPIRWSISSNFNSAGVVWNEWTDYYRNGVGRDVIRRRSRCSVDHRRQLRADADGYKRGGRIVRPLFQILARGLEHLLGFLIETDWNWLGLDSFRILLGFLGNGLAIFGMWRLKPVDRSRDAVASAQWVPHRRKKVGPKTPRTLKTPLFLRFLLRVAAVSLFLCGCCCCYCICFSGSSSKLPRRWPASSTSRRCHVSIFVSYANRRTVIIHRWSIHWISSNKNNQWFWLSNQLIS